MPDIVLTKQFVTTLAKRLKQRFGAAVNHTAVIDEVAAALGWKGDALMHKLKRDDSRKARKEAVQSLSPLDFNARMAEIERLRCNEKPLDERGTVFPSYLICLEDGYKKVLLKRHLMAHYKMKWTDYLAKHGLPADYPSVPPSYSKGKSSSQSGSPPDGTPLH